MDLKLVHIPEHVWQVCSKMLIHLSFLVFTRIKLYKLCRTSFSDPNIYIYFCRNFCVRPDFVSDPKTLKKMLIIVGLAMLLLSPFLVIFMLVYLFLRHAEQFYNHPSTASSRRWSNLSKWVFREFNEVSFLEHCLVPSCVSCLLK